MLLISSEGSLLYKIYSNCEKTISKYALPYEYEYVKELPKTKVGKVAFKELSKRNEVKENE